MRACSEEECAEAAAAVARLCKEMDRRAARGEFPYDDEGDRRDLDVDEEAGHEETAEVTQVISNTVALPPANNTEPKDLPVFIIFIHGFGCNDKGDKTGAATAAVNRWLKWTKDNAEPDSAVGFCNTNNMKIFKAVIMSTLFHRPKMTAFADRVSWLASMRLPSHRVVLMGDSYGGGIANSVALNLAKHEHAANLAVRTFGATYIPFKPPREIKDWINFMYMDDLSVALNRLKQPAPKSFEPTTFEGDRNVMWIKTGYTGYNPKDLFGDRMKIHRQYGNVYKGMLKNRDLRKPFDSGAMRELGKAIRAIGVRDKDVFKENVGFGRPEATAEKVDEGPASWSPVDDPSAADDPGALTQLPSAAAGIGM
jgi:hypothetical protein